MIHLVGAAALRAEPKEESAVEHHGCLNVTDVEGMAIPSYRFRIRRGTIVPLPPRCKTSANGQSSLPVLASILKGAVVAQRSGLRFRPQRDTTSMQNAG